MVIRKVNKIRTGIVWFVSTRVVYGSGARQCMSVGRRTGMVGGLEGILSFLTISGN